MRSPAFDSLTPLQQLIAEQAIVLAKELESTAEAAPNGQIIDHCERLLLGKGRDFLRQTLESTIQSRVEFLEKKGARLEPARAERRGKTKENRPKK
jgi:hypothetical protein